MCDDLGDGDPFGYVAGGGLVGGVAADVERALLGGVPGVGDEDVVGAGTGMGPVARDEPGFLG